MGSGDHILSGDPFAPCPIKKKSLKNPYLRFFFFLETCVSLSSLSLLGVRTSGYLWAWSRARRSGSRLEPSTNRGEMPNASRRRAFFSCCASAMACVSRTLQRNATRKTSLLTPITKRGSLLDTLCNIRSYSSFKQERIFTWVAPKCAKNRETSNNLATIPLTTIS